MVSANNTALIKFRTDEGAMQNAINGSTVP